MIAGMLVALLLGFHPPGEDDAIARGRQFYLTGEFSDGSTTDALMGEPATTVPASVLPCMNCHGRRGYGRPEGGMLPANITWDVLTRPYELVTENGRRRPAYDAVSLVRAITHGLDSGGETLDANMPRYQLNAQQAADLVAWLRHMQQERDPGIETDRVRIGLIGARGNSQAGLDASATWQAFARDLAKRGGIYGRRMELVPLGITGNPVRDTADLRTFVQKHQPFMLVMLGETAVPPHLAHFAHNREIPLVGGRAVAPPRFYPEVFYLYPGEGVHGQVLAAYAERTQGQKSTAILTQPGMEKAAEAIVDWCAQDGWLVQPRIFVIDPQADMARTLNDLVAHAPAYILNMGIFSTEVDRLATRLEAADQTVTVFSPASLATTAWFEPRAAWQGLLLTTPVHTADLRKGAATYARLAQQAQLPAQPRRSHLAALAAASILQDGLFSTGRELSREALIGHLETTYRFETGFSPALSYGPNRRTGAEVLYLHAFDFEQKQSQFIEALSLKVLRDGF